jgi:hypothetical protein
MRRQVAAVFPILCSISLGAWADAAAEIDHLLGLIGSLRCLFVRNGDEYDTRAAKSHNGPNQADRCTGPR